MAGRALTPIEDLVDIMDGLPPRIAELIEILENLPILLHETRRARRADMRLVAEQTGINIATLYRIEHSYTAFRFKELKPLLLWLYEPSQPAPPEIAEEDLRVDTFHVKTDPVNEAPRGVQLTHLPTGIQVGAAGGKSQLENKAAALQQLRKLLGRSDGSVQPGVPGLHGQPGVAGDTGAETPTGRLEV